MKSLFTIVSLLLFLRSANGGPGPTANSTLMHRVSVDTEPTPLKALSRADTLFIRDTSRKLVGALITPRVSLTSRSVERTTVREHYLLEMTNPHLLEASLSAIGLHEDATEMPMPQLSIEEFLQIHAHPTLGFVFFEPNSAEIPARYDHVSQREAKTYSLKDLSDHDDIDVHRSILNIIAKRMLERPNANLTVTGCNTDVEGERNNIPLSMARAESVKEYLTAVWGIPASRIKTEARALPQFPSSTKSQDGQEENRRAEISSDDPEIMEVFMASDTSRVPTPPMLRFRTNYQSASPVQSWALTVSQKGRIIKTYKNQGAPPKNIDWDLTDDEKNAPRLSTPMDLRLTLQNSMGDITTAALTVPVVVRTLKQKHIDHVADTTIERYNLVLFNYAKAELTPAHDRILSVLKNRLKPGSQIVIEGFADRTGSTLSNNRIATARAIATKKALGRDDARIQGVGEERLLYPNDTPEGRFLCRTVQITVHTPSRE